jgi:hypothetical protein
MTFQGRGRHIAAGAQAPRHIAAGAQAPRRSGGRAGNGGGSGRLRKGGAAAPRHRLAAHQRADDDAGLVGFAPAMAQQPGGAGAAAAGLVYTRGKRERGGQQRRTGPNMEDFPGHMATEICG